MISINATLNRSSSFTVLNSFSVNRRRILRRRRSNSEKLKKPFFTPIITPFSDSNENQSLVLVLDVNNVSSKFNSFVFSAKDAYNDLKTLITVDESNRVLFKCKRSTVLFTGSVFLYGFVLVFAFRVLVNLGLGFSRRFGGLREKNAVVVRRDRSLGGKEVVVARRVDEDRGSNVDRKRTSRVLDNPLSWSENENGLKLDRDVWRNFRFRRSNRLPKWWPASSVLDQGPDIVLNRQEYRKEANRLVRAITDYRTSGRDVMEADIVHLRRICRASGVQVSFDTTNTRDAFYRTSVNFVLNICERAPSFSTSVVIDSEDAQHFVAGLAENIGLENNRAARMVSAAVAARTRACFVQAWALEVQGKHSEAVAEISKMCLIFRVFPPDESSPEMEMVARGLGKNLNVEQRECLLDMFKSVCGKENHRTAAEALGLFVTDRAFSGRDKELSSESAGDQHEDRIA